MIESPAYLVRLSLPTLRTVHSPSDRQLSEQGHGSSTAVASLGGDLIACLGGDLISCLGGDCPAPAIANYLNKGVAAAGRPPLRVLVQVNTSGEESE
ncbi:unnamed protein product [Closterium sp. NIES-64]|nr:unnamed protein product [Closterium sp. NIES-64]